MASYVVFVCDYDVIKFLFEAFDLILMSQFDKVLLLNNFTLDLSFSLSLSISKEK